MTASDGTQLDRRTDPVSVEVEASPERVWRALTEARELARWFPLDADLDPGAGGRIVLRWGHDLSFEETIETWAPPHLLRTTSAVGGQVTVTEYRLDDLGSTTRVTAVTSGLPADAEWDDLVDGVRRGWMFELAQLKTYLEGHDQRDRHVCWVRLPLTAEPGEAWARLIDDAGVLERLGAEQIASASEAGRQWVGVTRDPPDGLVRLSIEPSHMERGGYEVSLWISMWGEAGPHVGLLESELRQLIRSRLDPPGPPA